ncbi:hypothetical protein ACRE_005920 [Hapsidospora chrysogenum ATCC 11550]|uniref:Uncharacterized protein n=1 Tax=Hapsidospora chrysogenum (strain ATCC 11550 / CBS 779.69 / DSM 880 / IAM 14645 / JCM 23072 / IMI 49137) TaxID=857340 RepID=A0A086TGT6_HAPC1|nr:hypothetical protein ACRE_005920 [Hapsidospora chrysogenum ATCC 11550]
MSLAKGLYDVYIFTRSKSDVSWATILLKQVTLALVLFVFPLIQQKLLALTTRNQPQWSWFQGPQHHNVDISTRIRETLFSYHLAWTINVKAMSMTIKHDINAEFDDWTTSILASIPMTIPARFYAKYPWLSYPFLFCWRLLSWFVCSRVCHITAPDGLDGGSKRNLCHFLFYSTQTFGPLVKREYMET